jgi:23S rRNA G2069 N7-methylase RlmK/C1962 C5-methylase RlmI
MDKTAAQGEMLFNRLTKLYRHLKKWSRRTGTNAFRLYDRDIPEIPLVLDLYDDAISGALYKRPYEKDDEEGWLCAMKSAAARATSIPEDRIFLKVRQRMRHRQEEGLQYGKEDERNFYNEKNATRHFFRDVREGDLVYRVNLSDYLDTGLFLDARKKRALIRAASAGKRVLNLFAYTCSLSVCATKGGASQVDSVDLSKTYLEWGKVNFALNKLQIADSFSFIHGDVIQFINHARKSGLRWDLIILDPPSFSNSKRMRDTLDLRRDHQRLICETLSLLDPGGTLWFSSSVKGIRIDAEDFPDVELKDMAKELVDEDFRGKRMPVCYTLTKP